MRRDGAVKLGSRQCKVQGTLCKFPLADKLINGKHSICRLVKIGVTRF